MLPISAGWQVLEGTFNTDLRLKFVLKCRGCYSISLPLNTSCLFTHRLSGELRLTKTSNAHRVTDCGVKAFQYSVRIGFCLFHSFRESVQVLQHCLAHTELVPAVMKQQQRNAIECLFPTDLKNADGSTESIFKVCVRFFILCL